MRYALFAALLAVAACQTTGEQHALTNSARPLELAEEPDCSNYPGGITGAWCYVVKTAGVAGRAPPCQGLTGAAGHECRIQEIRCYEDLNLCQPTKSHILPN